MNGYVPPIARGAIILEQDGRTMIYELAPEYLSVEPEEMPYFDRQRRLTQPRIRITLEGWMLRGRMWEGPMPTEEPREIEPPAAAVGGSGA